MQNSWGLLCWCELPSDGWIHTCPCGHPSDVPTLAFHQSLKFFLFSKEGLGWPTYRYQYFMLGGYVYIGIMHSMQSVNFMPVQTLARLVNFIKGYFCISNLSLQVVILGFQYFCTQHKLVCSQSFLDEMRWKVISARCSSKLKFVWLQQSLIPICKIKL